LKACLSPLVFDSYLAFQYTILRYVKVNSFLKIKPDHKDLVLATASAAILLLDFPYG